MEVYKNTITDDDNAYGGNQIEMRSTSGIIWGNTSTQVMNKLNISIDHERSYRTDCSQYFDENLGINGYKAFGQPGWGPPQIRDMSQATFSGVFNWENANSGTPSELFIADNLGNTSDHLKFGRELFNRSHLIKGLLSDRPTVCSSQDPRNIYISTDENSQGATIYVCESSNTWKKHGGTICLSSSESILLVFRDAR